MAQTHSHAEMLAIAKTDHLLLLVGGNPLPNAIAAKLLAAPDGTITLIHSRGATGTADVAQRLRSWLDGQGVTCHLKLKEVEESNPTSIMQGVRACLEATKAQRVGLNYTGGTKTMSVHAYRTVEQWAKERSVAPVFSYLDARTLEMVYDPADVGSSERRIHIGQAVKMELTDLLRLHGWALKHQPTRTALLPTTAHALANALATDNGFKHWQQWIADELRPNCRRPDKEDWKSKTALQAVRLTLPSSESLSPVVQSLQSDLAAQSSDLGLVHNVFENEPKRLCEWLYGKWLEHHILDVLHKLADSLRLHEHLQNIVPNEIEFDVDVIAIRGYQFFAFSCSTDTQKSLLKLKLFEAYIRARQLGGDEARAALVCCSDDPDRLEHEMRRDVDPEGRIKVFGRRHFADFSTHIRDWIESQKGRES